VMVWVSGPDHCRVERRIGGRDLHLVEASQTSGSSREPERPYGRPGFPTRSCVTCGLSVHGEPEGRRYESGLRNAGLCCGQLGADDFQ
jgi:hypothetical protein